MAICIRCGANMDATYRFCESCGYPVQQQTKATASNAAFYNNSNFQKTVCLRCGDKLSASDNFCGKCGYSAKRNTRATTTNVQAEKFNYSTSANYVSQPQNELDKCIAELNKMCEYFGKAQSLYDDHDQCYVTRNGIVKDMKNEADDVFSLDTIAIGLMIIGTFIFSFGFVLWRIFFPETSFLALIIGGIMGYGGVMLLIYVIKHRRNYKKEIRECNARLASISLELTKHYVNYGYCIVGPEYTNPKILTRIRDIMSSRRAYTLDNAIKTLYHDCRRREFWARNLIEGEINNNNYYGANNASAFIPSNYFFDRNFRYY